MCLPLPGPLPAAKFSQGSAANPLDAAMAHASISLMPEMTPMSLELKVSYFAPARPGRVLAEGWIERRGRATCFAEGRLTDAAGTVLAKASSTIRLIPRDTVEAQARRAIGGK